MFYFASIGIFFFLRFFLTCSPDYDNRNQDTNPQMNFESLQWNGQVHYIFDSYSECVLILATSPHSVFFVMIPENRINCRKWKWNWNDCLVKCERRKWNTHLVIYSFGGFGPCNVESGNWLIISSQHSIWYCYWFDCAKGFNLT